MVTSPLQVQVVMVEVMIKRNKVMVNRAKLQHSKATINKVMASVSSAVLLIIISFVCKTVIVKELIVLKKFRPDKHGVNNTVHR